MGILRLAGLEGLRSSMRKEGPFVAVGAKRNLGALSERLAANAGRSRRCGSPPTASRSSNTMTELR